MKRYIEKVSVIIPIYNASTFMNQCVSSVQRQGYKNLEIILIDDGSTDGSASICDKLAEEDSRIKVEHKKNEGPAKARNYGMQKATGEYLCFVDSDDYLDENAIEKMLNAMEDNIDIVQCRSNKIYEDFREDTDKWETEEITLSNSDAMRNYLLSTHPIIRFSVWAKLIRTSITEKIYFPNIRNGEDVVFNIYLLGQCQNVKYIPESLYFYTVREDSLSKTGLTEQRIMSALHRDKCIKEFIESQSCYGELLPRVCWVQLLTIIVLSCRLYKEKKNNWKTKIEFLHQTMCEIGVSKKHLKLHQYIIAKCYKKFPFLFLKLVKKII